MLADDLLNWSGKEVVHQSMSEKAEAIERIDQGDARNAILVTGIVSVDTAIRKQWINLKLAMVHCTGSL